VSVGDPGVAFAEVEMLAGIGELLGEVWIWQRLQILGGSLKNMRALV
jgi:hypothetical protein